MFVTLLIAGEDQGQMRPGLAKAVAEGEEIIVLERRRAPAVTIAEAEPVAVVSAVAAPAAEPAVEVASYAPAETPAETPREVTPKPVFTLSSLPTVIVDPVVEDAAPAAPAAAAGDVWYVTVSSVNVREGPSTETSVVDKLKRGEAVLVAFEEGSEWAKVTIQGDGLEGYVALRFLSPEAP